MNSVQHRQRSTPRSQTGLARRFLIALFEGADDALRESRGDDEQRAEDDQQCRLRPGYSRMTRGYEKIG